jgi:hypothetical protein
MTAGANVGDGVVTITPALVYAAPALDGSNFVNVPGDNLGNHTATQNLNLGANSLVGNGGSTGLTIASTGAVATAGALTVAGALKANGLAGTGSRPVTVAADGTLAAGTNPQLSISGSTISLTNGGSVTLPATPGDNLGNHTATTNLNLGTNLLVGNGGSAGLSVSSSGNVGIGTTAPPATTLDVRTADNSAAVTVGNTGGTAGALYLGNPNHGLKRNYASGNDVGLFTTGGSLYLSAAGGASTTQFALASNGNVGLGTTSAAPATQKLDVRGNLRLGDDGGSSATGTGPALEWVGPGLNTDPVGLYRVNPGSDQSELRVVVGDGADANDRFVVGRMPGTSSEGGIPTGTFTPNFTVRSDGTVGIGTGTPTSTLQVAGSVAASIRALSSGTIADTDYTVLVIGNVSLPAPSAANSGRLYHLINGNVNTYTVTGTFRDGGSGGTVGSVTLNSVAGNRGITVQSDGSQWWILTRE